MHHHYNQAPTFEDTKMDTQLVDFFPLYFGTPVAILSSQNADETTNLTPISSWWILEKSIVFGLGTSSKCYENLLQNPDVVLNIPDSTLWSNIESIAATTGKEVVPSFKDKLGYRIEKDKFSCSGLTETGGLAVSPGRIQECPVQIEARIINSMFIGNCGKELVSIEANILNTHVADNLLCRINNNYRFEVEKWKPLYYVFRHYFSLGKHLGENFRCN